MSWPYPPRSAIVLAPRGSTSRTGNRVKAATPWCWLSRHRPYHGTAPRSREIVRPRSLPDIGREFAAQLHALTEPLDWPRDRDGTDCDATPIPNRGAAGSLPDDQLFHL
jgi:hypothetical protein